MLQAGKPKYDSQQGQGMDFLPLSPQPNWLWHSLPSDGYWNPSLGVKQPGHEANHSPPSSVRVKNSLS